MSRRADQSGRLEGALEGGPIPHDEDTRQMLAAAGALQPGYVRSPSRVRSAKEAMLREYARTQNPQAARKDAGSGDGLDEPEIHRLEVELPDGGQLVLTDIEDITPERAEKTAGYIARILNSKERDHQS
ncbi:hypothetical protein SSP531S_53800 [Streptomyces spongiicola]|uniref:Uncharacterized protein n=1 Tax=Streptomyces spongiicola TaxID=1690221 RepID=A0A388T6Q4_9ACTN|nr:hypothetical protein [Streptomyces spongiicola]GBQ03901.1 hypothetical protein SSP531S_53800 [Streptomyces spongiicola]